MVREQAVSPLAPHGVRAGGVVGRSHLAVERGDAAPPVEHRERHGRTVRAVTRGADLWIVVQLAPETAGAISPRPACCRSAGRRVCVWRLMTSNRGRHAMMAARWTAWVLGRAEKSPPGSAAVSALR